jgi:hypothetical protein
LGAVGSRGSPGLALHDDAAQPTTDNGEGSWKCLPASLEGSASGAVERWSSSRHQRGRRVDGEGRRGGGATCGVGVDGVAASGPLRLTACWGMDSNTEVTQCTRMTAW